jgi:hypothetical protein
MSNLKVIVTDKERTIADVEDVLRDAIKIDYESILVVGIKGGDIYTNSSKQMDMAKTLGLIEIAKYELFKSW